MENEPLAVTIIPLVDAFERPVPSSRKTRETVPAGYGRREQCRPFVEANGAGLTIPSPFAWGYCLEKDVPAGARAFRSPVSGGCSARVFYVQDDAANHFRGNQFAVPDSVTARTGPMAIPGLSFFEMSDQQQQVKLHLPYILRTDEGMALLFVPPINRSRTDGLQLLSGLVETAWYADAVNMVFTLPPIDQPVHVQTGEPLAQAIPVPTAATRTKVDLAESHRKQVRVTLDAMAEWRTQKTEDRSAYKRLAKSR
ncbi:DUF6065 family protein [uncultured Erythrobacter sp.]|uniref:DUF6065 family protein n=1 Tax=uncultured Erythrobacter sp. TaxID=263913 RepID=UPI002634664D|nr:DUF6065 family protein [uncultured Erythrobacter sp.]